MNKVLGIILIVSSLVFVGCAPEDVDTGAEDKKVEADKAVNKNEKRFKAGASTEVLGVKVNIAEVVIKPDKIEIGMNLENTNSNEVNWYPDQEGKAIIGDKQLDANMFMGGDIGGEIAGGVKQDGVLVFPTPNNSKLDPEKIEKIKLDLGEIATHDFMKTDNVQIKVEVK
ncbi:hypothetical protein [Melghirimyces algeriensis]|uniref:DUF4352 domain-containing protein n=1 Tax=Melghirimyces algeriensis TaxID=910412 RepID=A0A521DR44_9BACL|nr:hypothetical protein [Melghirimyces algeriensis]SMO73571.1 hypothetical protein SAMN06264849_106172 [Melghirimyces algeriensis]